MADSAIIADMLDHLGAVVLGRRTYDVGEGPWGDDPPFPVPCFVLTHRARPPVVKKGTTITFVDRGIEAALDLAKQAAGDKNVLIMGGAPVYEGAADRRDAYPPGASAARRRRPAVRGRRSAAAA